MADLSMILRNGVQVAALTAPIKVAILSDVKAYNADGGTFTSGAWRTRNLNTEADADSIVSLSSNRFTPIAGTYLVEWSVPAYNVVFHTSRLYNYTQSSLPTGGTGDTGFTRYDAVITHSLGRCVLTANGTDAFEIQHYSYTTIATTGFGVQSGVSGIDSVFTQVKLIKIA